MGGEEPSTLLSFSLSSRYYCISVTTRTASLCLVGLLSSVLPVYSFILTEPTFQKYCCFMIACEAGMMIVRRRKEESGDRLCNVLGTFVRMGPAAQQWTPHQRVHAEGTKVNVKSE